MTSRCETVVIGVCPSCRGVAQFIACECLAAPKGTPEFTADDGSRYWVRHIERDQHNLLAACLVRFGILAGRMRACNEEPQKHDLSLFEIEGWQEEIRAAIGTLPAINEGTMAKYRKKPVVTEAAQWWQNGDHPADDTRTITPVPGDGEPFQSEGKVVRRYHHPNVHGDRRCRHCDRPMFVHGWIDTLQGGHVVCPGDWIITDHRVADPRGHGHFYPCKPDIFAQTYDPVLPTQEADRG